MTQTGIKRNFFIANIINLEAYSLKNGAVYLLEYEYMSSLPWQFKQIVAILLP